MAKTAKKTVEQTVVDTVTSNAVDNVVSLAKARGRPKGSKNSAIDFDPASIKVESGIPIPAGRRGRASSVDKYPFKTMTAGDAFNLSVTSETADRLRAKIVNAAKAFKDANPSFNYTSRLSMREDGTGILTFWRLDDVATPATA